MGKIQDVSQESDSIGPASAIAPRIAGGMKAATLLRLARLRKIPHLRIGHRTVLFDVEKVKAALARFEVKAVV
jgi:hypothetical protein